MTLFVRTDEKNVKKVSERKVQYFSGHVRIGPDVCLDESRIISREHEDFVTWRNKSKIRAKLNEYNDEKDDYEFEC